MSVLIDTSIWSLALRRNPVDLNVQEARQVEVWGELVRTRQAVLIGPIRQELLTGVRDQRIFEALADRLSHFNDLRTSTSDYVRAAGYFNTCRARGVTGSSIDLLICAMASRQDVPIFTTDTDFKRYAKHLPIRLYDPRASERRRRNGPKQ